MIVRTYGSCRKNIDNFVLKYIQVFFEKGFEAKFVNTRLTSCFCGRHIGRTQNTEIPTRPNQTVTFVEICLYVYHIVVFEFNSVA